VYTSTQQAPISLHTGHSSRGLSKPPPLKCSFKESQFWKQKVEDAWREASIVWLCGVRRCGKTTLAKSFGDDRIRYVNCDLPVSADMTASPELFYKRSEKPIVVFDEIHQLPEPSRLLKIGADMFPDLKIVATGSSTLGASRKFKDTLIYQFV
ncbi:MAG: AAA family ATPase, partial [Kiritimatiellia bacterium]